MEAAKAARAATTLKVARVAKMDTTHPSNYEKVSFDKGTDKTKNNRGESGCNFLEIRRGQDDQGGWTAKMGPPFKMTKS